MLLNARADIRRLFRADGLSLKEEKTSKPSTFKKAISLPEQTVPFADQIKDLHAELVELTELVLSMNSDISLIKNHILLEKQTNKEEIKVSVRAKKAIDYLSTNWSSVQAITRDMELPIEVVKRKLNYLLKQNKAEKHRDLWRKK